MAIQCMACGSTAADVADAAEYLSISSGVCCEVDMPADKAE